MKHAKQWEHMLLFAPELGFNLVNDLNRFGKEGFEAVGFVNDPQGVNVLLKREVPETKPADESRVEDPHWPDGPPAESTDPTTRAEDLMAESHGDIPDPRR